MKTSNNIQTRREFFKNAAKAALPVLGAVVLSNLPIKAEALTSGCKYGCQNECVNQCYGSCYNGCYGCKGTCESCKGSCQGGCNGSCVGSSARSMYPGF